MSLPDCDRGSHCVDNYKGEGRKPCEVVVLARAVFASALRPRGCSSLKLGYTVVFYSIGYALPRLPAASSRPASTLARGPKQSRLRWRAANPLLVPRQRALLRRLAPAAR